MSDHKGASLIFHALPDAEALIADKGYDSDASVAEHSPTRHLPLHPASGKAPLTGAPLQNPV